MKILYATDVHEHYENLKRLEEYRKYSKPDLFVLSGDILGSEENIPTDLSFILSYFNHLKLFGIPPRSFDRKGMLYYLQLNFKEEDFPYLEQYQRALPYIAKYMANDPKGLIYTRKLAQEYLDILQGIDERLRKKYKKLESIVKPLLLPGNYDLDLDKINKKRNLHQKVKTVKGFKIAGYGSANYPWKSRALVPPTIPVELTVPYLELTNQDGEVIKSEPKKFFLQTKPDVAFIHMPLLGYGDHTKANTFAGGKGILEYARTGLSKVIACGHVHEDIIVERVRSTENREPVLLVNPGALMDSRFAEIIMNDKTGRLEEIALYCITGTDADDYMLLKNVILEKKYFLTPRGELSGLILNKPVY